MKIFIIGKNKILIYLAILLLSAIAYFVVNSSLNPPKDPEIVILGWNDLGMHCIQPDYSQFLILPPGNNIKVQIFSREPEAELLTEGIIVKYNINLQQDPTKYTNFWEYAAKYGYNVPAGIGITGNSLQGLMKLDPSKRFWQATAVPVTSLADGTGPASPYQTATITVLDQKTNKILAEFDQLVVPVSPEMDCLRCHKQWVNILKTHDNEEATQLYADSQQGILHRCNECHADPILNEPGKPGYPSLSLAMHGYHADKMGNAIQPVCYNCHPGIKTDCNRGVMKANNLNCQDCHGGMNKVAASIREGRIPWLEEPDCKQCHGEKYKVNPAQLYRNSYLLNGPDPAMNNKILCGSCHNSPHAEWPSLLPLDNALPLKYQGKATYIKECRVCHLEETGTIHQ